MARVPLSQRDLFCAIDREYQRLRTPECLRCRTPLPIRRIPLDDSASNWQLAFAEECPHHCQLLLISIAERLQPEYALSD